ncbi:MAG: MBL fold metallo-hydrolase [Trueperaceae bacterium]|nr:MBL fold metallo-hydrolase [Trueperaceae bacterium]
MKPAYAKDDTFLESVHETRGEASSLHIWWLGQSGFLIKWQNRHLLLDPYLSDSLTTKYAQTAKPHLRMTERVMAPEKLDFIDIVTSSHNHTDHLDTETLVPLMNVNKDLSVVVAQANLDDAAERLQVARDRLTGIKLAEPLYLKDIRFHAVPAAHEGLEFDEQGEPKYIGLIIQIGEFILYHSGDTVLYDGMIETLSKWQIDLALLPINGHDPSRGVAGNLSAKEAVSLAKTLDIGCVIPCHYDMFSFNTVSPESFVAEAEKQGQGYYVLENGEGLSLIEALE